MLLQSRQAETLYTALFDWQTPLSLWECSEQLKTLLGEERLSSRDTGPLEIKKILEGWVTGKALTMAYHGEPCLVRVASQAAMDAQIYHDGKMLSVEVTQALYPGRKRNVFGQRSGGFPPFPPLAESERPAYEAYLKAFTMQAFQQVEARIEHKFHLYKSLDYLLVYVDLFDMQQPRFGAFALQDFYEESAYDLKIHLEQRFRAHWRTKIGHLFMLNDQPTGFVTRFTSPHLALPAHAIQLA